MAAGTRIEFEAFVAARGRRLQRSAEILCGMDVHRAEDLVQTALSRAYVAWPRISADDPERYVRRVMVNLAIDWWRSPLARFRPSGAPPKELPSADLFEDRMADRDRLRRALEALSSRERAAVVMRFYWDLTEQQTATELGWPVGSVKSTTSRALRKLRNLLSDAHAPATIEEP